MMSGYGYDQNISEVKKVDKEEKILSQYKSLNSLSDRYFFGLRFVFNRKFNVRDDSHDYFKLGISFFEIIETCWRLERGNYGSPISEKPLKHLHNFGNSNWNIAQCWRRMD